MPLFMDLHKASDYDVKPTIEEIKTNHIADLKVQEKYGVKFLQYWINEEAGLVFCLMEAPDKEACAAVHREAHGNIACNVIELQGGDYSLYMGNQGKVNTYDIVEKPDGSLDPGHRTFLVLDVLSFSTDISLLNTLKMMVKNFEGRETNIGTDRVLIVFNSCDKAIEFSKNLMLESRNLWKGVEIRIGIAVGEPVGNSNEFFGNTKRIAIELCDISAAGQITISSFAEELADRLLFSDLEKNWVKVIHPRDEIFLNHLFKITQEGISNPGFNVENLGRSVGMSRAQLYRKMILLTGLSPNHFVQEQRMKKAIKLLKKRDRNIAEICYEVGYNSPSYFAKTFNKRFGILPIQAIKQIS